MTNTIEAYKTKIYQLLFGTAIVGLGLMVLRKSVAVGNSKSIYTTAVLTVVAALILFLDKYFWALGCFIIFIINVPGIRANGLEIGAAVLVCMYFLQSIIRRQETVKPDFPVFTILLPYLAWVVLCFIQNPCGLYIFGSANIGFRFYVTLCTGLAALFVLSRMAFSEKDAKILFWLAIGGVSSYLIINARVFGRAVSGSMFSDDLHYELAQIRFVAMLLLCRFSISKIISDWRLFLCLASTSALCIYTGNRTTAATPFITMSLLPFLRKKERGLVSILAAIGMFFLLFLAAGQGHLYRLPQGVQKSLSFLPGNWDDSWRNYGFKDAFRKELREQAKEFIREKPWTGRKGFAMNLEQAAWIVASSRDNSGHAFSGNWHNLWLGLAADFGIPCAVFFGFFFLCALIYSYRNIYIFKQGTWLETMYLFFFLRFFLVLLNSCFNGGHSAKSPQETFVWLGFCLALINGRKLELLLSGNKQ